VAVACRLVVIEYNY